MRTTNLKAVATLLLIAGCTARAPVQADPDDVTGLPATAAAEPSGGADTEPILENLWTRTDGEDWPQFLGPTGDSKSSEKGILTKWPAEGPRIVWQRELGISYGIGSISKGRFYQFDRVDDQARLTCMNAETGKTIWEFEYPTDYVDMYYYNGGPRASPVIDGNRVYIMGVEGMLHCVRADNGEMLWKVDTMRQFGVVQNFFGVGSTPVLAGDLLIVQVGGSPPSDQNTPAGRLDQVSGNGTGIVAFDKYSGQVKYKVSDELASYSTPRLAMIEGRQWCFVFARGGLVGIDPSTGKLDFHYPWRARILESVNASTPVVVGNQVFISETYGPGSSLLEVRPGGYDVVWKDDARTREKAMQAHWNTPIFVDGYLYGCSGRNPPDADLRCIEWKTGKVMWVVPNQTRTSLLHVDGHFVCLGEFGTLQLIKVNPQKHEIVSEVVLRGTASEQDPVGLGPPRLLKQPCWAAPILSHGLLYVRGEDRLVCLDLKPAAGE